MWLWRKVLNITWSDKVCNEEVLRRVGEEMAIISVRESGLVKPYDMVIMCISYSVGCLWHSHGKNPVRLYPKLQSQPIGLRKIFIDYLFSEANQSDCTKSVSIFNRFASSEER